MTKTEIEGHLLSIIESPLFQNRLELISRNYPNQKQEFHIRNAILEIFNECNTPVNPHMKAVAESRINGKKIDLCITSKDKPNNPFKIEFKFQFSRDFNSFKKYRSIIESDYEHRQSDAFILIVAHWNKKLKAEFDNKWNITPNLNQYICHLDPEEANWYKNIKKHLESFQLSKLKVRKRQVKEPYPVYYSFFFLFRKNDEDLEEISFEQLYGVLEENYEEETNFPNN